ncbi:hypothetical protein [Agrococcus sp. Marseille-Q4369]|uniref:hypothetical protein n=1 Tax=Agrococcus sp. Marseille-Q4369 TaxID=2810513 RepID=UPI001B8C335F|nr:hypothetical protein [Agrococcus sp. Marseille-Q4369]QUW18145.1 hypothetical protein JSQ78_09890 [Agrococcus sp. Marseille-Q4369]
MSAAGYAAHRSSFTADDWWRMEAAAFRGEDRVRDALALTAPGHLALMLRGERRGAPAWQRALSVPKVALIIGGLALTFVWGLPVFAWIFLGDGGGLAVASFGIIATVSLLLGIPGLVGELRSRGADRAGAGVWIVRGVPAVLGAIGAIAWLSSGAEVDDSLVGSGIPVSGAWVIPMVADAVLSVALVLLARRGARSAPTLRSERSVARLADAVGALPLGRREEIALDVRAAIDTLERAGAIDAAEARRARAARLGELAATMAPERATA